MSDIEYIYRVKLPHGITEAVLPDTDDDGYTIYISDRLSDEQAMKAYKHALRHIKHDDWGRDDVNGIEQSAHA